MIYLSQLLGNPSSGRRRREGRHGSRTLASPRARSSPASRAWPSWVRAALPIMISWRKFVDTYDEHRGPPQGHCHRPCASRTSSRTRSFSPRDILNKQIVDTHGMRVVARERPQALGHELHPAAPPGRGGGRARASPQPPPGARARGPQAGAHLWPSPAREDHRVELHGPRGARSLPTSSSPSPTRRSTTCTPADIADIIERLDPRLRGQVFAQLDDEQRAGAMAEFDDRRDGRRAHGQPHGDRTPRACSPRWIRTTRPSWSASWTTTRPRSSCA